MRIPDTVGYALAQAARAHRNLVAGKLATLGLHPGQEFVLMQLWQQDGLTHSELVARCQVEAPTVSRTVQRMAALGVVSRGLDERDARVSRVYLTERGRELREPVERMWRQAEKDLVGGMTAEERLLLRRLLISLRENLA